MKGELEAILAGRIAWVKWKLRGVPRRRSRPICPKGGFPLRPTFVSNELQTGRRDRGSWLGQVVPSPGPALPR